MSDMKRTNGARIFSVVGLPALILLSMAGCDDGGGGMDAGLGDAAMTDGGPIDDGDVDAGSDGGNDPCDACTAGEVCVRDVCLDPCGADASGWSDAIGAGLTPVATFCRDADRFGTHASMGDQVLDLTVSATATGSRLSVGRWTAVPGSPVAGPSAVGSVDVDHASDSMLFLGGYLDVSPSLDAALCGYTLSDAGFPGEVFSILTADGTSARFAARGNFDATWLSADTFLVNGFGLDTVESGQGLYAGVIDTSGVTATQIGVGLGDYSGSVGVGEGFVVAGGFYADGARVYAAPRTAIEGAISGARGAFDFETEGLQLCVSCSIPSAFDLVGDRIVVQTYDDSFLLDGVVAYPIESYDETTGLSLGAVETLATGAIFDGALSAGGDRLYLTFAGGLLLVE